MPALTPCVSRDSRGGPAARVDGAARPRMTRKKAGVDFSTPELAPHTRGRETDTAIT